MVGLEPEEEQRLTFLGKRIVSYFQLYVPTTELKFSIRPKVVEFVVPTVKPGIGVRLIFSFIPANVSPEMLLQWRELMPNCSVLSEDFSHIELLEGMTEWPTWATLLCNQAVCTM